jgi:hypothetical protein
MATIEVPIVADKAPESESTRALPADFPAASRWIAIGVRESTIVFAGIALIEKGASNVYASERQVSIQFIGPAR